MDNQLSYLLVIVADDLPNIKPNFDSVFKTNYLIHDNFQLSQYVYNDSYSSGLVEFKIYRNWESDKFVLDSEYITLLTKALIDYTGLKLSQVDHNGTFTLCKFTKPKTEEPIKITMPLDLEWITSQKDVTDVVDNKK